MSKNPSILAVDANPVERNLIQARLNLLDCEVQVVADAERAIALLDDGLAVDLILTDIRLNGLSGLDLLRHVRQLRGMRSITPVIAVTAMAMRGDRERLLDAGMDGYLAKPYRQTAFEVMIARFTGEGRQSAFVPPASPEAGLSRALASG